MFIYTARQLCGITIAVRPFFVFKRCQFFQQCLAIIIPKHMENMLIYTNKCSMRLKFGVARYCLEKNWRRDYIQLASIVREFVSNMIRHSSKKKHNAKNILHAFVYITVKSHHM